MSSGKLGVRNLTELCADCGSLDPGWAVVNRGLLVCDECCSVHRSLGRHISQVKSLKRAHWPPTLLSMVHTLNNGGINSMWEALLNESKIIKKKPQPKDPVHPTKADFIRAKHQQLAFVVKSNDEDDDLNQQLHSIVRTGILETSMRLLAQGADPNYYHPEKGSRPLHVAAREGQISQVELLIVCGADPSALDKQGNTPENCARLSGHRDVSQRLIECLYEVPDRLAYFLCRRRPNHVQCGGVGGGGSHFIVPDPADCIDTPQITKEARFKLQQPQPEYSAEPHKRKPTFTCAQDVSLQLTNPLFEDLAMDVYDEVDRRETETLWQSIPASLQLGSVPFLPVNPDLSAMRNQGRQKLARFNPREFASLVIDILADSKRRQSPFPDSMHCRQPKDNSDDEPLYDSVASDDDYASPEQIAALVAANASGKPMPTMSTSSSLSTTESDAVQLPSSSPQHAAVRRSASQTSQSASVASAQPAVEDELRTQLAASQRMIGELTAQIQRLQTKVDEVTQENRELRSAVQQNSETETEPVLDVTRGVPPRPVSMYETRESLRAQSNIVGAMPQSEEVIRRTEQVTKRIQELWSTMQAPDSRHTFVPCAERIRVAVAELTAIFPQKPIDEVVRNALRQLNTSTVRLQAECANLESSSERVRTCAYNMAKANRQLLTRFQDPRQRT